MTIKKPKLTLVRGIPGSSKTTLATKLAKENGGVAVSADDFFTHDDGNYKFNFSLIRAAHQYCLGKIFYHLSRGEDVYAHNTYTQKWEMEMTIDIASQAGYDWDIVEPTVKWRYDVEECARKNTHGVPLATIQKMKDRFESTKDILKAFEKYRVE